MIELSFRVTLKYRDGQAFIGEELDRAHSRVAERLRETLDSELNGYAEDVTVEVEPV